MVDCCEDPVIHERITKEIKDWIQDKAPGTTDSRGCSKKYHFYDFVNKGMKVCNTASLINTIVIVSHNKPKNMHVWCGENRCP